MIEGIINGHIICSSDWYYCFAGPIPSYCYAGISLDFVLIFFFSVVWSQGAGWLQKRVQQWHTWHRIYAPCIPQYDCSSHIFFLFFRTSYVVIRILEYRVFCLIYYTHLTFDIQLSSFLHFSTHFSYVISSSIVAYTTYLSIFMQRMKNTVVPLEMSGKEYW